jgi:hypothetical protein
VTGCGVTYLDSYLCVNSDGAHLDENGDSDPCHVRDRDAGTGDAGTGSTCTGNCVPRSPSGWSEPVLLWLGPEAAPPPECPSWSPQRYTAGHADLTTPPLTCSACGCDPPAGSCALPATLTASSSAVCNAGNTWTSFDPPDAWTGACTQANAIPAGKLCGGVPCTQSLSIAPLTLTESACTPMITSPQAAPPGPPFWSTVAYTCEGEPSGKCSNPGETCAPVVPPPPPGFAVCIGITGDRTCPDELSDKHVVYDHFDDGRTCSACTCSAPTGGQCTGMISYFTDGTCSSLLNTDTITSTAPSFCHAVPPATALGSKSAGPLTRTPGTCQPSGGDSLGSAEPLEATTFCCRP